MAAFSHGLRNKRTRTPGLGVFFILTGAQPQESRFKVQAVEIRIADRMERHGGTPGAAYKLDIRQRSSRISAPVVSGERHQLLVWTLPEDYQ